MPTVLRLGGYRFFFFSNEGAEAHYDHIECGGGYAKFRLEPVRLERSSGFNAVELNQLRKMVEERQKFFKEKWNEHFSGKKRA